LAFSSCLPLTSKPLSCLRLLLYPIDAGLLPSAFYYEAAHFTSERGLHVSALHPAVLSSYLFLYLVLFLSLFLSSTFHPHTTHAHRFSLRLPP
jgi:hypothetical protein